MDFLLVLIELFLLGVTAEALRAKIDKKIGTLQTSGHHPSNFRIERPPAIIFAQIGQCMPYNLCHFYTKKFCSRLSSSEVRLYTENGRFAFLSPSLGA